MGHEEEGMPSQSQGCGGEYMDSGAGQWEVFITMRLYNCLNCCESRSKMICLCVLRKLVKCKVFAFKIMKIVLIIWYISS